MKNLKKIVAVLLSMTAIASTTAFATEAKYTSGTASLENVTLNADANAQLTVVIVPKNAEAITSDDIYYINQGAFGEEFTNILKAMKVKDGFGTATDYEIRIGGVKKETGEYTVNVFLFEEVAKGYKITGYVADTYATVAIGEKTVEVGEDGSFSFDEMANGVYELMIKAPGAFNRKVNATVNGADVAVSTADNQLSLVYGAVRADAEKIEFDDLSALLNVYRAVNGVDSNFTYSCDFDRNGKVEFDDLSVLLNNYRMTIEEAYAN